MRMRISFRLGLMAVFLSFGVHYCRAQARTTRHDDVCSIIAHPADFAGKRLEVRGLLSFVTGDAAPPDLLTGDCSYGIPLIVGTNEPGARRLWDAELKPRPTSSAARRIWATFSGRFEVNGDRFDLQVDKVTDIVVLPNFALISAQVPRFPEDAPAAGGSVTLAVKITKGHVVDARVVGRANPVLARASIQYVRTWQFASDLDAATTTTFQYHIKTPSNCPPDNPTVELRLPQSVTLTRWKVLPCSNVPRTSSASDAKPGG